MRRVIIVNQYGNEVCELSHGMNGWYAPADTDELMNFVGFLEVGDKFEVVEVESDEQ